MTNTSPACQAWKYYDIEWLGQRGHKRANAYLIALIGSYSLSILFSRLRTIFQEMWLLVIVQETSAIGIKRLANSQPADTMGRNTTELCYLAQQPDSHYLSKEKVEEKTRNLNYPNMAIKIRDQKQWIQWEHSAERVSTPCDSSSFSTDGHLVSA